MTLDKLQTFSLPLTQNWKPNTRNMLRALLVQAPRETFETRYFVHQTSPGIKVRPHTLGCTTCKLVFFPDALATSWS